MGLMGLMRLMGLGLLPLLILLAGCSGDSEDGWQQEHRRQSLTLFLGAPDFSQTRSLPDGYKSYGELYPQANTTLSTIKVFMTSASTCSDGVMTYKGDNVWSSEIAVDKEKTYHIYGFMPSSGGAILGMLDGESDYTSGSKVTINNLDAVTPADICVIVGVKETNSTGTVNTPDLGYFSFLGKAEDNYSFLLLDHLYAGLHFRIRVDEEYNTLRTIMLKELKLKANGIQKKVNVVVNLWSKEYAQTQPGYDASKYDPIHSATYMATGGGSSAENILFPLAEEGPLELTTGYQDFLGCFAPGTCRDFTLISTYDVYDRKGNLIRKNEKAENHITFGDHLARGKINRYNMTVAPTYLYVLSEPDLDNPTIEVTAAP